MVISRQMVSKQFLSKVAFATLIVSTLLGALALRAGENPENTLQERVEQGEVDPRDQEIAELKKDLAFWKKYFDKHETMIVNDNLRLAATKTAMGMIMGAVAGHGKNGVRGAFEYGLIGYTAAGLMHGIDFAINAEKLRPNNAKKYYCAAALLAGPAAAVVAAETLREMGNLVVWKAGLAKQWAMDWLTQNCSSKGE